MRCGDCKFRQRKKLKWEWAECECHHVFNLIEGMGDEGEKPQFHAEFGCRYFENRTAKRAVEKPNAPQHPQQAICPKCKSDVVGIYNGECCCQKCYWVWRDKSGKQLAVR